MRNRRFLWHGFLTRVSGSEKRTRVKNPCHALFVVCASIGFCIAATAQTPTTTSADKVTTYAGPILETAGPVAYYTDYCARCHGSVDIAYGAVNNLKRGPALKQSIKDMAEGPSQCPLNNADLEKQYDLHLAVIDHAPYVWLDDNAKDAIAGEVMPDSTVELRTSEGTIKAKIEEYRFVLPKKAGTLVVTRRDLKGKPVVVEKRIESR